MKAKILSIIFEFISDLSEREKRGFKLQVVGSCVYDVAVGNQGAYCALKDLQERINLISEEEPSKELDL
jgi:hypothetical protein